MTRLLAIIVTALAMGLAPAMGDGEFVTNQPPA
jgi:hypothetical protein